MGVSFTSLAFYNDPTSTIEKTYLFYFEIYLLCACGIGFLTMMVGFVGWMGSWRKSSCLMNMQIIMLFFSIFVKLAFFGGALIWLKNPINIEGITTIKSEIIATKELYNPAAVDTDPGISQMLVGSFFSSSYTDEEKRDWKIKNAWDKMQEGGQCCGFNGPDDWSTNSHFLTDKVPEACCINSEDVVEDVELGNHCPKSSGFTTGCEPDYTYNSYVLMALFGLLTIFELIGAIFSCEVKDRFETQRKYNPFH